MSWEKINFGSLYLAPTRNGIYKDKSSHGSGVKIVNMGEIFAYDFIGNQDMQRIEMTPEEMQTSGLKESDLLFARRSLVESGAGKASIVTELSEPTTFESSIIRVRLDPTLCYPLFYLYWLRCLAGRAAIGALVTGLNVKGIRGSELKGMVVDYPPIETQKRIAGILKRYDDLIENNQKQIKLLEEAAQRLYKEWFVDLRFPGHETTLITDGIPEGWIASTVGSICDLKKDTVFASKIAADTPYIGLEHMPRVDFCLSNWGTAEAATSNKFRYAENDIIFGKIRPYFHKVGFTLNSGVVSTDSFVMEAKNGLWGLLLMTVFDKAFVDYTYQTCKEGAKMPRADWNQMEKYPVLVPSEDVRQKFEDYMWTVTRRIKGLALQNHALAEARDRLLPKLMNGEIEV